MAVETTRTPSAQPPEPSAEAEEKVAPLELFFDLVFVLAITQVTAFIATDPTFEGLLRGGLILALIWWAWAAYAWLTN
jgi:low temperature requirement protein LtrA